MLVFRSLIQKITSYAEGYRTKNEIANELSKPGIYDLFRFSPVTGNPSPI